MPVRPCGGLPAITGRIADWVNPPSRFPARRVFASFVLDLNPKFAIRNPQSASAHQPRNRRCVPGPVLLPVDPLDVAHDPTGLSVADRPAVDLAQGDQTQAGAARTNDENLVGGVDVEGREEDLAHLVTETGRDLHHRLALNTFEDVDR